MAYSELLIDSEHLFFSSGIWGVQNQGTNRFDVCEWESASWFVNCYLFTTTSHGRKSRKSTVGSLVRALIPVMKTPPLWPNLFPNSPPPSTITLVSTEEFGLDTNIIIHYTSSSYSRWLFRDVETWRNLNILISVSLSLKVLFQYAFQYHYYCRLFRFIWYNTGKSSSY